MRLCCVDSLFFISVSLKPGISLYSLYILSSYIVNAQHPYIVPYTQYLHITFNYITFVHHSIALS